MSWARWQSVVGVVLLGMLFGACDNVTVVLEEVPANTPSDAAIYVAGNFNFWDPGDPAYRMKQGPDGRYTVDLPKGSGIVKFKFTRGDWTTVEGDECAKVLLDREVALGFQDTVFAVVQSWEDLQPLNCSRVTLVLTDLPENTPDGEKIAVTGSFNNWNDTTDQYNFEKDDRGNMVVTIPKPDAELQHEFKITRGSLLSAESDQFGVELPNRKLVYGEKDTVFLDVDGWVDITNEQNNSVTLVLDNLPDNTPKGAAIYVAGSFNNWYPKDRETRLQQNAQGKWQVTIPRQSDRFEFKFTRGHWGAEEVDARGRLIGNRSFTFGDADTLHLSIARWKDHRKLNSKHVTFVVTQLPASTPKDAELYLTSDGNGWDPKDENNRLQKNKKGQYTITLPRPSRRMQYKFTRGSWNTVEADGGGNEMRNREYRNDGRQEIFIEIASWTDAVRKEHKHITFVLESLPKQTPPNVKLYLATDINGWDPGSEKHVFQPLGDGRYVLTMQRPTNKKIEYKVTRGDWGSVEAKRKGRDIENRVHRFNMRDTVYLNVTGWIDR